MCLFLFFFFSILTICPLSKPFSLSTRYPFLRICSLICDITLSTLSTSFWHTTIIILVIIYDNYSSLWHILILFSFKLSSDCRHNLVVIQVVCKLVYVGKLFTALVTFKFFISLVSASLQLIIVLHLTFWLLIILIQWFGKVTVRVSHHTL